MKISLTQMQARGLDELGRPYWRIRAIDPATGKRITVDSGRWTSLEANDRVAKARARATLGLELSPSSTRPWTVSDVVKAYLEDLATRSGETAYLHAETSRLVHVAAVIGDVYVAELTRARVESFAGARRRETTSRHQPTARKSIIEEVHALYRAIRNCKELGRIDVGPPPAPSLKSIPDDKRPARRLTEAEVSRLIRAAEVFDPAAQPPPAPGTACRRVLDAVAATPGMQQAQIAAAAEVAKRDVGGHLGYLMRAGFVVAAGERPRGYFARLEQPAARSHQGLADLLTVLAWSGRRPVAVFDARREDCERLLDPSLPRAERLMYWRTDKGGIGRGWGPVPEPALHALARRAAAVEQPDGHLWLTATGQPFTAIAVNRTWHRIADRAELEDVQPYDLRRFAVTRLLREAQGQVAVVQRFTGHRSVRALLTYLYAEQGVAENMAESVGWSGLRVVEGEG